LQGDEANAKYQEAEAILSEDFPVIPLWYGRTIAGYSENLAEVRFTPFESVDLTSVRRPNRVPDAKLAGTEPARFTVSAVAQSSGTHTGASTPPPVR
jgi:hypothetical protein